MTKPTGRPRGRPKTKEYVTLMARVDLPLADHVKRYASLHRQPISVIIRDALTLLMDEYPFAGDRSVPHRLAAHEFLSDRYETHLDTLIGETDSTEVEALLADTNEALVETILSDANRESIETSDTKEGMPEITPDDKRASAATRPGKPAHARSQKVSDRKAAQAVPQSASTAGTTPLASDRKAATVASIPESPAPVFMSDMHIPAYDTSKHSLGKLCPRHHDYHGTGQSLLRKTNHLCLACDAERAKERRQAKHATARAQTSRG